MSRYCVAVSGSVHEVDAIDAEEAAREVVEKLWQHEPPGQDDACTAHVVEVGGTDVESWTVAAHYSLDGYTSEADDEPTSADLALLGVPRGA
mgnify:CR=1 FL=1